MKPHSVTVSTADFDSASPGSNPGEAATRRDFLKGLFGVAVCATLPSIIPIDPQYTLDQWIDAVIRVHTEAIENSILYGTSAIRSIDKFPFIENVPFEELIMPLTTGGLFDD